MTAGQAEVVLVESEGTHLLVVANAKDDHVVSVIDSESGTWRQVLKPDASDSGSGWACSWLLKDGANITIMFATGWTYTFVVPGAPQFKDVQ